jgi:hypothetical protein
MVWWMTALSPGHWGVLFMGVLLQPFNNRLLAAAPVAYPTKACPRQGIVGEVVGKPCIRQITDDDEIHHRTNVRERGALLCELCKCMAVVVDVRLHASLRLCVVNLAIL